MKRNLLSISTALLGVLASNILFAPGASAQLAVYPQGSAGDVTDIRYYVSNYNLAVPGGVYSYRYSCPSGFIVGGGFETAGNLLGNSGLTLLANYPSSNRQWNVRYRNTDDETRQVRIYLICAI